MIVSHRPIVEGPQPAETSVRPDLAADLSLVPAAPRVPNLNRVRRGVLLLNASRS